MCVCLRLTYGDIRGAVCLQEAVEVLPGLGDPIDDLNQVIAARVLIDLRLYQLPSQEAAEETFDRLGVICAQHPPTPRQMINGEPEAGELINTRVLDLFHFTLIDSCQINPWPMMSFP